MAEVFAAIPLTPRPARRVAIKRLHPRLRDDPQARAMLLDEGRILAELEHPNVVRLLEQAEVDGEPFLVLEHLGGTDLEQLRQPLRPWPPALAGWLVAELAAGLHAAHELRDQHGRLREVVHRDISPPNIRLTHDGRVKLLDFGVARARGREARTTRSGFLRGTLAYLAPETFTAPTFDRRADIFSMAVILWELCAGRRLFERPMDGAIVHAICYEPLPFPEELPGALRSVLARGLARDPDTRFPTAAAFGDAVRRSLVPSDFDGPAELSRRHGDLEAVAAEDHDLTARPRESFDSVPRAERGRRSGILPIPSHAASGQKPRDPEQAAFAARGRWARPTPVPRGMVLVPAGFEPECLRLWRAQLAWRSDDETGPSVGALETLARQFWSRGERLGWLEAQRLRVLALLDGGYLDAARLELRRAEDCMAQWGRVPDTIWRVARAMWHAEAGEHETAIAMLAESSERAHTEGRERLAALVETLEMALLAEGDLDAVASRARAWSERESIASTAPHLRAFVRALARSAERALGKELAPPIAPTGSLRWQACATALEDFAVRGDACSTVPDERVLGWRARQTQYLLDTLRGSTIGGGLRCGVRRDGTGLEIDGRCVDLRRRRTLRFLLARLVSAYEDGEGVTSVWELAEAGWTEPPTDAEAARQRVHTSIRRLRRLGLGDAIQSTREGYWLESVDILDPE